MHRRCVMLDYRQRCGELYTNKPSSGCKEKHVPLLSPLDESAKVKLVSALSSRVRDTLRDCMKITRMRCVRKTSYAHDK